MSIERRERISSNWVSVDLDFEKETNTGCLLRSLALFKGEKREWQQQINPILEKRG